MARARQRDRLPVPGVEGPPDPRHRRPGWPTKPATEAWTHEQYLAAVLAAEVSSREASGSETRIRAAGFPARKTIEEFTITAGLGRQTRPARTTWPPAPG